MKIVVLFDQYVKNISLDLKMYTIRDQPPKKLVPYMIHIELTYALLNTPKGFPNSQNCLPKKLFKKIAAAPYNDNTDTTASA